MLLTRELETLFFIILASAITLFAVFYLRQPNHFQPVQVVASLPHFVTADMTPTPTPTVIPQVISSTTSWTSSDGTEKLTMKKTTTPTVSSTYAFTVTNATTNTDTSLFVQTIPGVSTMSIPFNTFSSDNSYLYIDESIAGEKHYLVFKTSGEPFADGKAYLDVAPLFASRGFSYSLTDATGWASGTLLILNTTKSDGSAGPSLWFDVTTRGFIPLSTLFE